MKYIIAVIFVLILSGCRPSAQEGDFHHNIFLGNGAGKNITTSSYQFRLVLFGKEYQTVMSPKEYKHVNAVIVRAIKNPIAYKGVDAECEGIVSKAADKAQGEE